MLLLPEHIPKFQTHEGKQVFSINPIGTVWEQRAALLREGVGGILPKSKFPDASRGPTLQANLSKDSNLRDALLASKLRVLRANQV